MPNPWTGRGNPFTRTEISDRFQATLKRGEAIIVAGAGSGISAKFIERGGADMIIVYNSGRFRMAGTVQLLDSWHTVMPTRSPWRSVSTTFSR